MVNIWTYDYYCLHTHLLATALFQIDSLFKNIQLEHFLATETLKEQATSTIKVIDNVEEIDFLHNRYVSPIDGAVCWKDEFSTGCKAVLTTLWYSHYASDGDKRVPIDLSEAGPNALAICLSILDAASFLIGVMSSPLLPACPPNAFTIRINDTRTVHNWIGVMGACRVKEV